MNPEALFAALQKRVGVVVASIIALAIIFGGLFGFNAGLDSLHAWWYAEDIARMEEIKDKLEEHKAEIEKAEMQLNEHDRTIDGFDKMISDGRNNLSAIEASAPSGRLPSRSYDAYVRLLSQTNGLIGERNNRVTQRNAALKNANVLVEEHNALVSRANELAKKIGGPLHVGIGLKRRAVR